jgi:hypothetical protein
VFIEFYSRIFINSVLGNVTVKKLISVLVNMGVTTPDEHHGDYKKIREFFKTKIGEMEQS